MKRYLHLAGRLLLLLTLAACADSVTTLRVNEAGWQIRDLGIPVAKVYEIVTVDEQPMPTYNDCSDKDGKFRPPSQCSLDLIFVASPDYSGSNEQRYTDHVQDIILNVFGVPNTYNRTGGFGQPLRPFHFFATEYRHPSNELTNNDNCNPGLPGGWVPASDNVDQEAPSWDCNIALSTAGVELNVGFVMHMEPRYDRSRYNLFTAEYNSYAAILHELSHASFVIPDEGPVSAGQPRRWILKEFSNIFFVSDETSRQACEQTCSDLYNSHCVDIFSLDPDGILTSDITGIARCEATAGESISNLMYFYPQPEPGINEDWSAFDFYHAAVNRMQYIYDKCRQAAC